MGPVWSSFDSRVRWKPLATGFVKFINSIVNIDPLTLDCAIFGNITNSLFVRRDANGATRVK